MQTKCTVRLCRVGTRPVETRLEVCLSGGVFVCLDSKFEAERGNERTDSSFHGSGTCYATIISGSEFFFFLLFSFDQYLLLIRDPAVKEPLDVMSWYSSNDRMGIMFHVLWVIYNLNNQS